MTLTTDQGLTLVSGFNVYDTVLITQLIEKLLRGGGVTGKELYFVSALRTKTVEAAMKATGFNIEILFETNKPTETAQGG